MAAAITIDSLSKRYRIGEFQAAYGTLRDSVAHWVKRTSHLEHHERREI